MKFDRPAGPNPVDRQRLVGKPVDRIDGPLKTTGQAPYAYERHDVAANQAYGYVVPSPIAKGRINRLDSSEALVAPGVIAVLSTLDHPPVPPPNNSAASPFGGGEIRHYHQAVALIVAESLEQARAAADLLIMEFDEEEGRYDLAREAKSAPLRPDRMNDGPDAPDIAITGDFDAALDASPVRLEQHYSTPGQSHAMMEPFASLATWEGGRLTIWTSNQMIRVAHRDLMKQLNLSRDKLRVLSPYVGGGFGAKLAVRCDAVLAALGAKATGRAVKVTLPRPLIFNNTTHRPATMQYVRLGAGQDGRMTAIGHCSVSGNLPDGNPETAVAQTRKFYAAPTRKTWMKLAEMDLPEGNAMRAPGEAAGLMVLEIAIDELAEKLGIDPIELRILNDSLVDPEDPNRPYSDRHLVECLQKGAGIFGWDKRNPVPGKLLEGNWLIGMGVAAAYRGNLLTRSAARIRLEDNGHLTVETDMTDIGTGSYTILAQTAAEMLGVEMDQVTVRLGDSDFPKSAGSGGQWGANSSTAGLYAACVKLREAIARRAGFNSEDCDFADGSVISGNRRIPLKDIAANGALEAEDAIEFATVDEKYLQATFAAHFAEVAVDRFTGEIRLRRMLAVCDAGRILNKKTARSQVIGAMTMAAGAALMEELAVDTRRGFFVNHDLAGYEVPVHADIPEQQVIFLDYPDTKSSPMKAKGCGELGICGVAAAIANAVYNATGVRVRDYPITLDKHLDRLPALES